MCDLADVQQRLAGGGKIAHGVQQGGIIGRVAVAVAHQHGGIGGAVLQTVCGSLHGMGGGQPQGQHGNVGMETARSVQAAFGVLRLPCAEMMVGKSGIGFGADFAAAHGGKEPAVKCEQDFVNIVALQGFDSRAQIVRRIAAGCIERFLRAGQDNGFVLRVQSQCQQVGGIGQCVRAVQHQNAVIIRQFLLD